MKYLKSLEVFVQIGSRSGVENRRVRGCCWGYNLCVLFRAPFEWKRTRKLSQSLLAEVCESQPEVCQFTLTQDGPLPLGWDRAGRCAMQWVTSNQFLLVSL